MAKKSFKLEDVEFNCTKNNIEPEKSKALLADLQAMLDEESAEKEMKNPKEYVILIADPSGLISPEVLEQLVGWPVEMLEGEDPNDVVRKISAAAVQYNQTRSGIKLPAQSIAETISSAKKLMVAEEVWSKTQEPVRVLTTDNKLVDLTGG